MQQRAKPANADNPAELPRGVLIAAAVLIAFALSITAFGRVSGAGVTSLQQTSEVRSLPFHAIDHDDGSITIVHADNRQTLYVVKPGQDGFIRATLRGFVRERRLSGIDDFAPFTLTHWSEGTLSLSDSTTGRRVQLEAFGQTNAKAFAQFFVIGRTQ